MPANWLYMDAKFPDFNGDISTQDKLDQVQNYLYLLVEQMRYTMRNLDTTNMNQTALHAWEEAITTPLYLLLEGEGGRVTQLSATADGLTALVQAQQQVVEEVQAAQSDTQEAVDGLGETLAQVVSQVQLALTADQVELAIEQKLAGGVDSVTTKTGFTFDQQGLTVSKTGSEMTTQVTEDGMTVSRSGTQVLVVDNQGVQAANLNASTFLILAGKARFEPYGADRMGCFWIGG